MEPIYIVLISVAAALLVLFLIYVFLSATTRRRRARLKEFAKAKYAHRGLHNDTRAENSLSAFRAAVDAGYGIELDVRLSADGEMVVFHDDTLERVTEGEGRVDSKTLSELRTLHLSETADTVPTFAEVLSLVDGRVPLLVEIKEDAMKYCVTEKCVEMLREYKGEFIVESFNPLALWRFRRLMPDVPLGILSHNYLKEKKYRKPMYALLHFFCLNFLSRPDFVAYDHRHFHTAPFAFQRRLFRPVLFAWTVRSLDDEKIAIKRGFDTVIFEKYEA